MSFLDDNELAHNTQFINKIKIAMARTAVAVMSEDPATQHHNKRASYAWSCLHNPNQNAEKIALGMAAQGHELEQPDTTLEGGVSSLWNAYSGAYEEAV